MLYLAITAKNLTGSKADTPENQNYFIVPVTRASCDDSSAIIQDFNDALANSGAEKVIFGLMPEELGRTESVRCWHQVSEAKLGELHQSFDIRIVDNKAEFVRDYQSFLPAAAVKETSHPVREK